MEKKQKRFSSLKEEIFNGETVKGIVPRHHSEQSLCSSVLSFVNQTNSITAISAASPLLGPMRTMRV